MTRSRTALYNKTIAGSSLIIALLGTSACSSIDAAQNLAIQPYQTQPARPDTYQSTPVRYIQTDGASGETAQANTGQADYMPYGGKVMAPTGFLEMCQRSPIDCVHADSFQPQRIRDLASAALADKVQTLFASLHHRGGEDMQNAVATAAIQDQGPAAATDSAKYLTWSGQSDTGASDTGAPTAAGTAPLSYVTPLHGASSPSDAGIPALPGLSTPAAASFVFDFLDLPTRPAQTTELGMESGGDADLQPGAIQPGVGNDGGATLSWSNKAGDDAHVVLADAEGPRAPSVQYNLPTEPYDWAHVHVPAQDAGQAPARSSGASQVGATQSSAAAASDYTRIDMDTQNAAIVRHANDEVNHIMRGATDEQIYHVADFWNAPPLTYGVRGDCEDFALEKRRLLIASGIPAAALSIAIVRTRVGEEHAVLIVSTLQGDYVLDNLQYDVRPWRKAGYTWISRQGPSDDLAWVSLAPANGARSQWQSRTVRVAYAQ